MCDIKKPINFKPLTSIFCCTACTLKIAYRKLNRTYLNKLETHNFNRQMLSDKSSSDIFKQDHVTGYKCAHAFLLIAHLISISAKLYDMIRLVTTHYVALLLLIKSLILLM